MEREIIFKAAGIRGEINIINIACVNPDPSEDHGEMIKDNRKSAAELAKCLRDWLTLSSVMELVIELRERG